jgi:hypothetical protein
MPLSIGGSSGGLKWTITPGVGRLNSWAWTKGNGPKIFTIKTIRTNMWENGVLYISFKVCIIFK